MGEEAASRDEKWLGGGGEVEIVTFAARNRIIPQTQISRALNQQNQYARDCSLFKLVLDFGVVRCATSHPAC